MNLHVGSPRWEELSLAYHRMKHMDSSDAIRFLDKFVEDEKLKEESINFIFHGTTRSHIKGVKCDLCKKSEDEMYKALGLTMGHLDDVAKASNFCQKFKLLLWAESMQELVEVEGEMKMIHTLPSEAKLDEIAQNLWEWLKK